MKLTLVIAAILSFTKIVFAYHLKKLKMKIIEDNYKIISVPTHGQIFALLRVNDLKRGYSIYKVADCRTCFMVPLNKNEMKTSQLRKSVELAHGNLPSALIFDQQKMVMRKGPFNLTTKMGKVEKTSVDTTK